MPYSVTSWFVEQAASVSPTIVRQFTIAGSDYSSRVLGWPTISQKWDDLKPTQITIQLANQDSGLNFFRTNKLNMKSQCIIKFGFTHATSGDETITMFSGTPSRVVYDDGKLSLTMNDKIKAFGERIIGASNSAYTWATSGTSPSDIAWWVCTSFGGFSTVQSTSNPDIDWQSFQDWAQVFSNDTVQLRGRSEGKKCLEVLREIARTTRSAIFMKNDKIAFHRFTTTSSNTTALDNNHIVKTALSIEDSDIVNKQWVFGNYDATSRYWSLSIFDIVSVSVNSYGLRESVEKSEVVWYPSSASMVNLANRIVQTAGAPYDRLEIETTLVPIHNHLGEIIQATDTQLDVTEGWRIMQRQFNMDTGRFKLSIDASQINTPFILDVTSLDGTELLL